jgi:hypothetical protein
MLMKYTIRNILFLAIFWCSYCVANEEENTSSASGNDQIIVSPMSTMLDVSDTVSVNVLVINEDGDPIEGRKVRIVPQDSKKISVNIKHSISNESGYISFYILGKQQGNTVVTVTDGSVSSQIDIAVRNLISYVLPYFYGDMELNIINPREELNYVKIQFYENSDRTIDSVIVRLEGKEMKSVKLSEELDITLKDGWAEINSTEPIFGGIWTSKGYLSFKKIEEQ